jgi:hypothetical protein
MNEKFNIEEGEILVKVQDRESMEIVRYYAFPSKRLEHRFVVACNTFWNLTARRKQYNISKDWHYFRVPYWDWVVEKKWIDFDKPFTRLPDIFAFYDRIGWDHRGHKYTRYVDHYKE